MNRSTPDLSPHQGWLLQRWRLWQAPVRRTVRRWTHACMGFVCAAGLVWLWHADALEECWQTEQSLARLHLQLGASTQALAAAPTAQDHHAAERVVQALAHLPGQSTTERLWLPLQQVLARHRVQVLSLRPLADRLAAPLPSQAIALRLQSPFGDWAQAWAGMNEGVPVWSIDRLRIVPAADSADVLVDAVVRVWLRDGPDGAKAWAGAGVVEPAHVPQGAVFASSPPAQTLPAASNAAMPVEDGPLDSADPAQWPWARVRLVGIWQEAGRRHAILTFGPHWVWAPAGQRISREGHRLDSIGEQSVRVRSGQGLEQVLNFEKAQP